eukprot:TRINITY_DN1168_c0_g1_i4.p1 TRINITY_DN1168_c0_g1~~TRINITY_DN1168_c0_g1_i4.p1  ORF type:complete len:238 (-),score=56.77 TRINITY_DN1168_c0_g1_i4:107-820(-)
MCIRDSINAEYGTFFNLFFFPFMKLLVSLLVLYVVSTFSLEGPAYNSRCTYPSYYRDWDVDALVTYDQGLTLITYNVTAYNNSNNRASERCEGACQQLHSFSVSIDPEINGDDPSTGNPYIVRNTPGMKFESHTIQGASVYRPHSNFNWNLSLKPGDSTIFQIWTTACVDTNPAVLRGVEQRDDTRCGTKCIYAPRQCGKLDPCYVEGVSAGTQYCGCCEDFDSALKEVCQCDCACC